MTAFGSSKRSSLKMRIALWQWLLSTVNTSIGSVAAPIKIYSDHFRYLAKLL